MSRGHKLYSVEMTQTPTVPAAVAAFVSRIRREYGLTLDQVAGAARSNGASWSASSVSNIERGQASLTLPTLLYLALALGDLIGRPLTLSDLLGDAEALSLVADGRYSMKRTWVDAALKGAQVVMTDHRPIDSLDLENDTDVDESFEDEVLHKMREMGDRELTRPENHDALAQHLEESQMPPEPTRRSTTRGGAGSLAEERAAKKLGISTARLRQLAHSLWARPLEDESARRAGPGTTPQSRGRVTRVLVDEIRAFIKEEH